MSLPSWLHWLTRGFPHNRDGRTRRPRPSESQRHRPRLTLERLEDRTLPSNYTAASVSDLIADINAANKHGGSNTITLAANTPFTLTAVDNTADGATGLPVIKSGDNLTILGDGDTIERSSASGTPAFRLLDVASGGALTLQNLTLQNGLAFGSGTAAQGGAIYNQGTLVLTGVTVQDNTARGSYGTSHGVPGGDAAGGGLWSSGALTLQNGTLIQSNSAIGGIGGSSKNAVAGGSGGNGFGGGVYVAGGTVNLTNAILSNNAALGAEGGFGSGGFVQGDGGSGFGGGMYVASGTVSLGSTTVTSDTAYGGSLFGSSYGGGLYIAAGATVYLDAFTVANTSNNTADFYPDIDGSYILQ
jgi:hypothetical protein